MSSLPKLPFVRIRASRPGQVDPLLYSTDTRGNPPNDWDRLWKQGGFNRWPSEELVRWASTLPEGSKVLEVGCGAGPNLRALESFGHEPWGVDISTEALEASLSLPPLSRGAMEAPVSATDLPFADEEFDAVCDVQCFQHLTAYELPRAYSEALRVLRPGGRFFEVALTYGYQHFPALHFNRSAGLSRPFYGSRVRRGWSQRWWLGQLYEYTLLDVVK